METVFVYLAAAAIIGGILFTWFLRSKAGTGFKLSAGCYIAAMVFTALALQYNFTFVKACTMVICGVTLLFTGMNIGRADEVKNRTKHKGTKK